MGREYMGTVNTTVSGRQCQAWTSNTPHRPYAAARNDANFPDASRRAAKNYCRNPDGWSEGVWCFTMDPEVEWEGCDVPLCSGK